MCTEAVQLSRSPVTARLINQVKKSEFFTKSNTVAQERLPQDGVMLASRSAFTSPLKLLRDLGLNYFLP